VTSIAQDARGSSETEPSRGRRDAATSWADGPTKEVSRMEGARIRVLLVDDHGVVRRGLRGYLELLDDIEIVGEADNGLTAVEMSAQLTPDVVLMDIVMPQLDGIGAIGRIKAAQSNVQVVALTSFIEEEKVTAALEAGASGFILKDADLDDVTAAIRAAYNDEIHLDPAAARILAKGMRHRVEHQPTETLTERELEVLGLVGRGRSNKDIASELRITERTARTHVSNILGKLDLQSRTQAALYIVERRLVHD
jgi:DNA-binding NarL/FixJ family response regulator